MRRPLAALAALALALGGVAAAHASLVASTPSAGAVLDAPPAVIELSFSEGVEADFSTFKVVRLDAEVDLSAEDAQLRLNGLAAAVIGRHLTSEGEGEAPLMVHAAAPSEVMLHLMAPLAPGHYVVMWRALSEDTHTVDGHFVFSVLAGE